MMNTALLLTFLFMYDIRTCYSQGLLGSFVDFFNVNSPDASTGDSFNSSADGFSDFPPDPDFPPFGPDPGPSPDPGPGPDTGFPQDAGFPADPPASVNTDSAASGTGNQNAPIDTGVPSGTESSLMKNQQTVTEQFLPTDVGPSVGQVSPVQNTLSASGANSIGDNTNPIDPLIPGLSAQLTPLDPGLGGLPPQSGSPTPVDINAGGLPAQPGSPIPMDVNAVGLPAQTGSLTPVDINAGGQPALPGSPTQVDINAGGLPAQPTDFGSNNLPPFVIDSGDQQSGTGPSGPTQLDFHFLPVLPSGGNFVNLITGQTNTFQPSLGWIGDPGRPADISVEGPGSSVPLVDPAQIDTGMPNPDPPLTTNVIDVPADANLPPSNLPPEPPVALPVAPVETATPIETKPPVQHEGPFFVDPLSAFFDTPPADNQGSTQTDTTIFADNSVSGVNQDVTAGNQGGAISGGIAPEMIFPSGNQGDAFGSSIFPETISPGGNQEWTTGGSVFPETISPGGNQGDAMGGSTVPETIPSNVNQAGILTLFDRNDLSSPSQSLGNNKPAVLPFATSGTGNPVATNVVQQKERLPESWVKLYPKGREPRRQNPAFPSQSAPGETIEVSAADRILSDISLISFGRNRDLQRKLRKRRKQQRKQKKLLRQRQRERQQELQSQWQQPASQQPVSQQPARRQSRRQQRRGGNQRKGRQNRQRQNARLTVPSGGASSSIARMVLPGTEKPFVGKHQRGKRSVQTCSDLQRSLGLCSHGLAYPEVEYHVVSDTKAETNHHRRYKRNVQVCDPFSQLMGLCASNGMGQTQAHLVDTTEILTSNTGAIGNEAKPSAQEIKTPVTQTGVQSHVIGLHHLLGPLSNSILPGLAPITPEIMAVKNPVSQIFGQILNEAGQAANQGLRDLGRIVNNPGTNTQPLFEGLANVLGGQPIPQIGNINLSPLGILGEGVMVNKKGVPDSKPLGEVMKIKPPKKPMASKNKRNKPIVNEAGEMKSVHLSQSLGRSPTEFPSDGVNVISDPGFFNHPVNLASQVGPILSQSLDSVPADHVLDTHKGIPTLLPSKTGQKTKGLEKQTRGTEPIALPGVKTQEMNTVLINSDVGQPLLNPSIDLIPGNLSQPLGAFPADHVLDTRTDVPMLLPSKPGKKRKGIQKKIRGGNTNKNPIIKKADQILGDFTQPFGEFPVDHVLDTHTGVPMLLPLKPGNERKGIQKKIRGGNKIRNPSIKETDQILGDLLQPLGAFPADHVLDTHTGVPMLLPSKPGNTRKGIRKKIRGGNKSRNLSIKKAGQMMPVNLSPSLDLDPDRGTPSGGIVFSGTEILSDQINIAPELGPILPDADQIAIQGLNPKQAGKGIHSALGPLIGDLSPPIGAVPADHVLDTHTGIPMLLPSKPGKKNKGLEKQILGTEPLALPGGSTKSINTVLSNTDVSHAFLNPPIDQILGDLSQPLGDFPADHVLDTHTGVPMLLPSKPGKKRKGTQEKIRGGNNKRSPSIKGTDQILGDLSQPLGEFPADHVLDTHTGVPMLLPSKPGKKRKRTQKKNRSGNKNKSPSIKGADQTLRDLSQPLSAGHVLDTHTGVPMLLPSKPGKKRKGIRKKIRGSNKNWNPSVKEAGQMTTVNLSPSLDLSPDRGTPGRGIAFSSTDILNDLINVVPELGQIQPDADRIAIQGLNPNQIDKSIQPVLSPLIGDSSPPFGAVPTDHIPDTQTGAPILLPSKMRSKSKGLKIQVKGDLKQDKATMTDAGQMRPANVAPLLGLDPTGGMPHGGIMLSDPTILSDPMNVAPALGPILSDAEQLAITGVNTQPFNAGPANYEGRQPGVNPLVDTNSVDLSQPVDAVPADHLLDPHTGVLDTLPLKGGKKNKARRKPTKGGIRRKKRNFKKGGPMTSVDLPQQFDPGQSGDTFNGGFLLTDPVMAGNLLELEPLGANRLDQVLNTHPGVQDTLPSQQRKKNRSRKNSMRGGNKQKQPFIKKVGQLRPIDLSQHPSQSQDHVNGGSLVSGPTNLDSPMELSFSNTVFLNSEPLAANPAALPAGDSHNMQNPITQPIIKGPASYEGRQLVIGQPSNVSPMDFTQPLDSVLTEQVLGERNNGLNPKARRKRRKRRNKLMRNRNRKNRRTNAQRRPVMREVVQMKPVTLPQLPLQGSSVEIQTPEGLLAVHGQPSGHGDIKLLSTNVNIEGSNIQPDIIHPDDHVADHMTGLVDQSVPLKKRKNPRALARQKLKIIRKLRQKNKRRNQQNMREKQQNNRGNQHNKRRNGPRKGKVKVAKIMETVNLANGEKLPVTQPTTRPPNLDCFTGICIDWSGKKK